MSDPRVRPSKPAHPDHSSAPTLGHGHPFDPAPAVAERTFKSARGTEQHARLPSFSHGTKGRQAQGARRQRGPAFVGSAKRDTPRERRRQPPPSRWPVARASTTGRSKMAQSKVAYGNALGGNRPSGRQGRGAGRFLPGMPARGRRVADAAGLGLSCARDAATAAPTRSYTSASGLSSFERSRGEDLALLWPPRLRGLRGGEGQDLHRAARRDGRAEAFRIPYGSWRLKPPIRRKVGGPRHSTPLRSCNQMPPKKARRRCA